MPFPRVLSAEIIVQRKITTNYELRTQDCRQWRQGFSLIELLIVIAIFGLTISLITASYLSFERNQRLKNATLQLKNDLRLVQNNALSGNKGIVGGICNPTVANPSITLIGWYLTLDSSVGSNDKYTMAGGCNVSGTDQPFNQKTISMPAGVKISAFYFNNTCAEPASSLPVDILFEPLKNGVTFHNSVFTPPFYNADGSYANQLSAGLALCIKLQATQGTNTYQVVIQPSGEVNENKP